MDFVNGPENMIRLENNNKVVYLIMDIHLEANYQHECEDIESINIKDYLVNNFKGLKDKQYTVDFLLETFPDGYGFSTINKGHYLNTIRNLFNSLFNFNLEKNKVLKTKKYDNLRLHFIDIRSYLVCATMSPFSVIGQIFDFVYKIRDMGLYPNDMSIIKDGLTILKDQIDFLSMAINNKVDVKKYQFIKTPSDKDKEECKNVTAYLMDKILNKYKHKDVKEFVNKIINTELKSIINKYYVINSKLFDILEENYNKLNKNPDELIEYDNDVDYGFVIIGYISRKAIGQITELLNDLNKIIIDMYVLIMDLYCLRRVLDKDYITNAVIYTGGFHSINYFRFLVQYFNFKTTHTYYSKIPISEIDKQVRNMKDLNYQEQANKLRLFLMPQYIKQCVSTKQFPQYFS